jgi:hypothetical protein
MANGGMRIEMSRMTTRLLVSMLAPLLDRPVVDGTALKGTYRAALELPFEAVLRMLQNQARPLTCRAPSRNGEAPALAVGVAGPEIQAARTPALRERFRPSGSIDLSGRPATRPQAAKGQSTHRYPGMDDSPALGADQLPGARL